MYFDNYGLAMSLTQNNPLHQQPSHKDGFTMCVLFYLYMEHCVDKSGNILEGLACNGLIIPLRRSLHTKASWRPSRPKSSRLTNAYLRANQLVAEVTTVSGGGSKLVGVGGANRPLVWAAKVWALDGWREAIETQEIKVWLLV